MPCTDLLWRLAVALLTAFVLFVNSLSASTADKARTLAARPLQGDIVLDGFLNEPAWDQIPAATGADVFLVFNQTWDAPTLGLRQERDRQAILKMTYLIAV
jgi:hypothetical protein